MTLADKSVKTIKDNGFPSFINRTVGYIYKSTFRKLLPKTHYRTVSGVKVEKVPFIDKYMSNYILNIPDNRPNLEKGIIKCHNKYTNPGDSVVIVGGGNGVTAVHAANIVGSTGEVNIYEGGMEAAVTIKKVLKLNEVSRYCQTHHAVVAKDRDIFGGETNEAEHIQATELPECDVLELDCEGSEIDIIEKIDTRPDIMIIEIHPYNFKESPGRFLDILQEKGYDIESFIGHDGRDISEEEFWDLLYHSNKEGEDLIDRSVPANRGQELTKSGARWPVIIAAVHENSTVN